MTTTRIDAILAAQRAYFSTGATLSPAFRIAMLKKLKDALLRHEEELIAALGQEIFGPVLPVLTFDSFEEIFPLLADKPKPLALYFFSENRERIDAVTSRCRYGGGCINDTIIHLATSAMGFGGVGESGMGAYHGKVGFDTFSHLKSIVDKKTWLDLPMRYQPYRPFHEKLLRLFLR